MALPESTAGIPGLSAVPKSDSVESTSLKRADWLLEPLENLRKEIATKISSIIKASAISSLCFSNFYLFVYSFLYSCSQTMYGILCYVLNKCYPWPKGKFTPQGTFGNVWGHFWLLNLQGVCYWPTGRSQGCCQTSCNAQNQLLLPDTEWSDPKCQQLRNVLYFLEWILLHLQCSILLYCLWIVI